MSKTEKVGEAARLDDDLEEITRLKTQFDVFRYMKRITESYAARTFMVVNLPPFSSLELSGNTIITNWPSELLSLFDRAGLLQSSPVIRRLRRTTAPFIWDTDTIAEERGSPVSKNLFERFGLRWGACFPVHDVAGGRGAITIAGEGPVFSPQQMMELSYISIHVFNRLSEIRNVDNRAVELLTDREIDCLNWTAAGKTSVEIAEILGLSEHTVNHYLNRAARKLDTVNRTQVVAKALRIGLIK